MNPPDEKSTPETLLVRIPVHFRELADEILTESGVTSLKVLEREYLLVRKENVRPEPRSAGPRFIRWQIPIQHSWPCNPRKMPDFLERAAQTIATKFKDQEFQSILVGLLDPSAKDDFYRKTAMGLRGRINQLSDRQGGANCKAEDQSPQKPTLYCMIGDGGLFAGISTPREANGFYPGGSKFISHKAPHMISRAGAKIAEALHYIGLYQRVPPTDTHWLELGACPGGMTSELLQRSYRVTALDRSALDPRLKDKPGLSFLKTDVAQFAPDTGTRFGALLCDMNGESEFALGQVLRLSRWLQSGALVVFTLKTAGISGHLPLLNHFQRAVTCAERGGLSLITNTHLTTNRQEFTLFFVKN